MAPEGRDWCSLCGLGMGDGEHSGGGGGAGLHSMHVH